MSAVSVGGRLMSYQLFGKWILAGEHAVLRGGEALVFPVRSCYLKADVKPQKEFEFSVSGKNADTYKLLIPGLVERALEKCGKTRVELSANLAIESTIPIGSGLGASAALCVLIGKWFVDLGWVSHDDVYEFSRQLENVFHGESSGVDIACALSGEGIRFHMDRAPEPLSMVWRPNWRLTHSGHRGLTAECVKQVKALHERSPDQALALDEKMQLAVKNCREALGTEKGFDQLADAMKLAGQVFQSWGLVSSQMQEGIQELYDSGAKAVKPTGSGGGGFLLSLWEGEVPEDVENRSISVW